MEQRKFKLTTQNSIVNNGLIVDETCLDMYPDHVVQEYIIYSVTVKADSNCLPRNGSVLAFGNESHQDKMRVGIVVEQTLHKDVYLSYEYLQQGHTESSNKNISTTYAMFSDEYVPGRTPAKNEVWVKDIY